jgi:hypothetical protein
MLDGQQKCELQEAGRNLGNSYSADNLGLHSWKYALDRRLIRVAAAGVYSAKISEGQRAGTIFAFRFMLGSDDHLLYDSWV